MHTEYSKRIPSINNKYSIEHRTCWVNSFPMKRQSTAKPQHRINSGIICKLAISEWVVHLEWNSRFNECKQNKSNCAFTSLDVQLTCSLILFCFVFFFYDWCHASKCPLIIGKRKRSFNWNQLKTHSPAFDPTIFHLLFLLKTAFLYGNSLEMCLYLEIDATHSPYMCAE